MWLKTRCVPSVSIVILQNYYEWLSLDIWDEAHMMNRHCFEAFDRTIRDIVSSETPSDADKVFGGKVVVLGGDF